MSTLSRFLLASSFALVLAACANAPQESVWIDVRTVEEYSADHIDGDANIPLASIDPVALAAVYGKDAQINLYCRSGNRAGQAKTILEAAGFTNVVNAGGIGDAREMRNIAQSSAAQ
jgi:phage shock protein E